MDGPEGDGLGMEGEAGNYHLVIAEVQVLVNHYVPANTVLVVLKVTLTDLM